MYLHLPTECLILSGRALDLSWCLMPTLCQTLSQRLSACPSDIDHAPRDPGDVSVRRRLIASVGKGEAPLIRPVASALMHAGDGAERFNVELRQPLRAAGEHEGTGDTTLIGTSDPTLRSIDRNESPPDRWDGPDRRIRWSRAGYWCTQNRPITGVSPRPSVTHRNLNRRPGWSAFATEACHRIVLRDVAEQTITRNNRCFIAWNEDSTPLMTQKSSNAFDTSACRMGATAEFGGGSLLNMNGHTLSFSGR